MVPISNADFNSVLRLLTALSRTKGESRREREDARKAGLLAKKLKRKENGNRTHKDTSVD